MKLPIRLRIRGALNQSRRHAQQSWFQGLLWAEQEMGQGRVLRVLEPADVYEQGALDYQHYDKHDRLPVLRERFDRLNHDCHCMARRLDDWHLGPVRVFDTPYHKVHNLTPKYFRQID